jgi:hypothetical protein
MISKEIMILIITSIFSSFNGYCQEKANELLNFYLDDLNEESLLEICDKIEGLSVNHDKYYLVMEYHSRRPILENKKHFLGLIMLMNNLNKKCQIGNPIYFTQSFNSFFKFRKKIIVRVYSKIC